MIYPLKFPFNFNDCCRTGSPNLTKKIVEIKKDKKKAKLLAAFNTMSDGWLKGAPYVLNMKLTYSQGVGLIFNS